MRGERGQREWKGREGKRRKEEGASERAMSRRLPA